ncbi:MAG: hypothetical protein PWQ10_238 [Patescibacteria group bacterium]|nr:hypothetical protein [Patescibacteria group bacterium]
MVSLHRKRRAILLIITFVIFVVTVAIDMPSKINNSTSVDQVKNNNTLDLALTALEDLEIKGRAPKTNYSRAQFGATWTTTNGCDTRNIILNRDLLNPIVDKNCNVISGVLNDPYTGESINFIRGSKTSSAVQIDHVVALSDAWQKGAQQLTLEKRIELANDPLELLAVDGIANQQKSDGDAATWLPSNKPFRCQYVARQVSVKRKYGIWVTQAEYNAMINILNKCLDQLLPTS